MRPQLPEENSRHPWARVGLARPYAPLERARLVHASALLLLALSFLAAPAAAQIVEESSRPVSIAPPQPLEVEATYFSGQTFITWRENAKLQGETYRVYRSTRKITPTTLASAVLLYEVPEGSSTFWSDYYPCGSGCNSNTETWEPRFSATMPLPTRAGDLGQPADPDQGMLVWTIGSSDIIGGAFEYHYAVTTVDSNGNENRLSFSNANRAKTSLETVEAPRPLKLQESMNGAGVIRHVYVQYMDLHTWNPTLTAPNAVHQDYGQILSDPKIARAISYAFSYVVLEPPTPQNTPLPVILKLHPYLRDKLGPSKFQNASLNFQLEEYYDYPAIEIRPIDVGSTWWFGFADKGFDYRAYPDRCAAIDAMTQLNQPIQNYTEARVLRMLYDLERDGDYWMGRVDPERFYVIGHSMGGGGALALAIRYPNIFAAAQATAGVTNFYRLVDPGAPCVTPAPQSPDCPRGFQVELAYDVAAKWGPSGLGANPFQHLFPGECAFMNPEGHEQPIVIDGPGTWAQHLEQYEGTPVYAWQDHLSNLNNPPAREVVPLAVHHSSSDDVVNWPFQGKPLYEALNDANISWSGLVEDFIPHITPWWFLGLSPNFAEIPGQGPFFGLSARLSETVPSIRLNPNRGSWLIPVPSPGIYFYNSQIVPGIGFGVALEWSSSWHPWDGLPTDNANEWAVSLRTVDGSRQVVDISPRRAQAFQVLPGQTFTWKVSRIDGSSTICGCITADARGVITLPNVVISGAGRRISIRHGIDPDCKPCISEGTADPVLQPLKRPTPTPVVINY